MIEDKSQHTIENKKKTQELFVRDVIETKENVGITTGMLDRVFELEPGTVNKWKNGEFPHEALVLLKIISTFPFVIEAAQQNFDPNHSKSILVHAAADELIKETYLEIEKE